MQNPYLQLTDEFNRGRIRAMVGAGPAIVLHRLAVMSKDGDWILREDDESTAHVLGVLAAHGAHYRLGAPLDCRWLMGGWSSHLEYRTRGLRIRTDFVTRPPRIPADVLAQMWSDVERSGDPVVGLEPLAAIKLTDREKDYAIVGELARRMTDLRAQPLYSRSSRDLLELAAAHAELVAELQARRPVLAAIDASRDRGGARPRTPHADADQRSAAGTLCACRRVLAQQWTGVAATADHLPLAEAHAHVVTRALGVLPFTVEGAP